MADEVSEPIEVLLVVDRDVFNRFGSAIRHLCVGFMDEPVRVTVLSNSQGDRAEEAVSPWRVVRLPRQILPWRRWSAANLLQELEIEKPQIVHCFSAVLAIWARDWCTAWGSRQVVHLTDLRDVREFTSTEFDPATTIIAGSDGLENLLLQRRPEIHAAVHVVPFGIPAEAEPCCLAQPERIPATIMTATLTRECGMDRVLRALHTIVRAGQEVQLFVLSTGPAERIFRQQVQHLGLISQVTFAGKMRDWSATDEVMHGADFYIMPAPTDRFTANRLLAMAAGLAIVAPAGTTEDYLIDGETASLFDPHRPQELAAKWLALLEDRAAARQLAHGALDHVRAHHQASTMVTATAFLYRQVCDSGVQL